MKLRSKLQKMIKTKPAQVMTISITKQLYLCKERLPEKPGLPWRWRQAACSGPGWTRTSPDVPPACPRNGFAGGRRGTFEPLSGSRRAKPLQ